MLKCLDLFRAALLFFFIFFFISLVLFRGALLLSKNSKKMVLTTLYLPQLTESSVQSVLEEFLSFIIMFINEASFHYFRCIASSTSVSITCSMTVSLLLTLHVYTLHLQRHCDFSGSVTKCKRTHAPSDQVYKTNHTRRIHLKNQHSAYTTDTTKCVDEYLGYITEY